MGVKSVPINMGLLDMAIASNVRFQYQHNNNEKWARAEKTPEIDFLQFTAGRYNFAPNHNIKWSKHKQKKRSSDGTWKSVDLCGLARKKRVMNIVHIEYPHSLQCHGMHALHNALIHMHTIYTLARGQSSMWKWLYIDIQIYRQIWWDKEWTFTWYVCIVKSGIL